MVGAQDGGMERQRNLILPERPQRGYWQFLYKYQVFSVGYGTVSLSFLNFKKNSP
jgi:hypothetical protein